MIDESTVISRINTITGYTAVRAEDILENWQAASALPIIYVGYATIDSKQPNVPLESSIFNTNGEDLVQSFEINIVTSDTNFRANWIAVYNALIGWNPIADEVYHSGFTYAQGGKMGRSNGKIWHTDIWRIGFPTNHVLT